MRCEEIIRGSRVNMRQENWIRPARDFSEVTLSEHLEEQLIRLGQYETLSVAFANMIHDFNNLMTIISGNVALAKMNLTGETRIDKWLTEAQEATSQASDLARQLLNIARGGYREKKLSSLKEAIRQSMDITLNITEIEGILDYAEDLWKAYIDEGQIRQVIINLLMNAIQSMPEGGKIYVETANAVIDSDNKDRYPPGQYIKIAIRDQGGGIPEEYNDTIFEPFFTTKENGTGLGLSSSYSIIKSHQGYINFNSNNKGTTFNILLPAVMELNEYPSGS